MQAAIFDTLDYFEKLKEAGVPEKQAKVQADAMRCQNEAQISAYNNLVKELDEKTKHELATKGDVRESELRLQKEIEKVRAEMHKIKYDLLLWQFGIGIALAVIMAKGFNWIGF